MSGDCSLRHNQYPYTVSVTTIKSVVSRFNIVFFIPENDYSNSFRIFLVLIFNIHCFSFTKKRWVPQVSQLPDDLQFSNTRHISDHVLYLSLSMGISEEIEDAKITVKKTKISRLKRRSENWPKFAWSNRTLRYKTVNTRKHYREYLLFLNFGIWPHFTETTWCQYKAETTKIVHC